MQVIHSSAERILQLLGDLVENPVELKQYPCQNGAEENGGRED